jgi:hypothetical protein
LPLKQRLDGVLVLIRGNRNERFFVQVRYLFVTFTAALTLVAPVILITLMIRIIKGLDGDLRVAVAINEDFDPLEVFDPLAVYRYGGSTSRSV